jgi:hypothetical protein
MSIKINYVRVYDFNKEKKRLRNAYEEAKTFNSEISYCIDNVNEQIEIEGEITSLEGQPAGKLGFPVFTMQSNGKNSSWERKSHRSLLGNYPKDKLFKVGKKIKLTYGLQPNEDREIFDQFNTKWVLYIDLEELAYS